MNYKLFSAIAATLLTVSALQAGQNVRPQQGRTVITASAKQCPRTPSLKDIKSIAEGNTVMIEGKRFNALNPTLIKKVLPARYQIISKWRFAPYVSKETAVGNNLVCQYNFKTFLGRLGSFEIQKVN